ncbi:MAG: type II secretion system F family protein [Candidatus Omnitrophica bacterium]|nr:type II secretion system F family protein [Candidatus Omnitrophota bacterium]
MPLFTYKVRVDPRTVKTGTITAENERAAVAKLLELKYHPLALAPVRGRRRRWWWAGERLRKKETYLFLRQIANLAVAGIPLITCLQNMSAQSGNARLRSLVNELREHVQKGMPLSEAMEIHTGTFTLLDINMLKAAETTGTLPETLEKIADIYEQELSFSQKLRAALSYPLLLSIVGTATLFVLSAFVLPKFVALFDQLEQRLPLVTQALVSASLFMEKFWPAVLGLLALLAVAGTRLRKAPRAKRVCDETLLKIPYIGAIISGAHVARFARTLGNLIGNGVPILNALRICVTVLPNAAYAREIETVQEQVSRGSQIWEALRETSLIDRNTLDLISIGEQSGRLDEMLFRVARMHERETAERIETFLFLLEPLLILFFGAIVALIVIAILLPILQMNFIVQ